MAGFEVTPEAIRGFVFQEGRQSTVRVTVKDGKAPLAFSGGGGHHGRRTGRLCGFVCEPGDRPYLPNRRGKRQPCLEAAEVKVREAGTDNYRYLLGA